MVRMKMNDPPQDKLLGVFTPTIFTLLFCKGCYQSASTDVLEPSSSTVGDVIFYSSTAAPYVASNSLASTATGLWRDSSPAPTTPASTHPLQV